jgi:hypothetical protein
VHEESKMVKSVTPVNSKGIWAETELKCDKGLRPFVLTSHLQPVLIFLLKTLLYTCRGALGNKIPKPSGLRTLKVLDLPGDISRRRNAPP